MKPNWSYDDTKALTLEDIAWNKSFIYGGKQSFNTRATTAQSHFYEGFIAGFTYKFTGETNETT
jgi:hypothetical protein